MLLYVVLVSFTVTACSASRSASLIQMPQRPVVLQPAGDQEPVVVDGREYHTRQTDEMAIAVNYINHATETYRDYLFFYVEVSNLSDKPLTVDPAQFACETDSIDRTYATDPDARISELSGYLAGNPLPKQEEEEGMSTGQKVLVGIFFVVVVIAMIAVLASGGSDDDDNDSKKSKKKKSKSAKKSSSDRKKTKKSAGASSAISEKSGVDKDSKPAKTSGSGSGETSNDNGGKSKGRSGGSSGSGRSAGGSGGGGSFSFWFESYHYYDDSDDDYEPVEKVETKTAQLLRLKNRWGAGFIRKTILDPGETVKGKIAFPISETPDEVILRLNVADVEEAFWFRSK